MPSVLPRFRFARSPKAELPEVAPAPVSTPFLDTTDEPTAAPSLPLNTVPAPRTSRRLRDWIQRLQTEPQAEAVAAEERRARLLEELSQAVADAPDDLPIGEVVRRLNRHADD